MKNRIFLSPGRLISALSIILLAASCSEEPGRYSYSSDTEFVKTVIHDQGGVSFYEISPAENTVKAEAVINWNIIEFDNQKHLLGMHRQKLSVDEYLYIPLQSESVFYVSYNYESAEGSENNSSFIRLDDQAAEESSSEKLFITLEEPGKVISVTGSPAEIKTPESDIPFELVSSYSGISFYRLYTPGYYDFQTVSENNIVRNCNVFVSPIKSIHTDRTDLDWYFTQFRTTTTSNCGPTVVSMGIAWAKGEIFPVSGVREFVGWRGSGAVNYEEMQSVLTSRGIKSEIVEYESPQQIFRLIDYDKLVGISYNMAGISFQENPGENMFDQYYVDSGGHYLAIKGYSFDEKYFIIYDPIPSDWAENAERYSDGRSMYGRNRYYLVDELVKSFTKKEILVIHRNPQQ